MKSIYFLLYHLFFYFIRIPLLKKYALVRNVVNAMLSVVIFVDTRKLNFAPAIEKIKAVGIRTAATLKFTLPFL